MKKAIVYARVSSNSIDAFNNILDKITTDVVVSNITRVARDEAIQNEVIQKLNNKNCKLICIN